MMYRFWLIYCDTPSDAVSMATKLYTEAIVVPFMANFVVFAKRRGENEAQLRVFCMTDDKMDKTLECQERFCEIARSRDVEVLPPLFVHFSCIYSLMVFNGVLLCKKSSSVIETVYH